MKKTQLNNTIKLQIEIPQVVYDELKTFIETTIASALHAHIEKINAAPTFLTRDEAAAKLRISLPTLDRHLNEKRIESKRAGKRILIPLPSLEAFMQNSGKSIETDDPSLNTVNQFMTLRDASIQFRIGIRTLYRMEKEGQLKFYKLGGRTLLKKLEIEKSISIK